MSYTKKMEADGRLRVARRLVRGAAAVFAGVGVVMLYGARDYIPPLAQPDPVTGLTTRALLGVAGLVHLAISAWLCAGRDPISLGLIACWAALNYGVYLCGAAWLQAAGAIPAVVVLAWELGVGSKVIYAAWGVFIGYLVLSGLLLLLLERRWRLRLEGEAFLKGWGKMREAPAPPTPGGRASPRAQTSSESLKASLAADFRFACPACGQHIRCEAGYRGRKIACPACRKEILVPEANGDALSRPSPAAKH
jgi:hypothetical protein